MSAGREENDKPRSVASLACREQKTSDDYEEAKHRLISLTDKMTVRTPDSPNLGGAKKPGWRSIRSSAVHEPQYKSCYSSPPMMLGASKSNTSISSNGPLKEFIRDQKPQIRHRPTILFKLDPAVRSAAEKMAGVLAQKAIREPSLTSIKETARSGEHERNNKFRSNPLAPGIDPDTGLMRGTSFQRFKVFAIDDEDELTGPSSPLPGLQPKKQQQQHQHHHHQQQQQRRQQ